MSRAHPPEEKPAHPIGDALKLLLDSVEERKEKRVQKWEKNADKRKSKGETVSSECNKLHSTRLFFMENEN